LPDDTAWLRAAIALSRHGRGRTAPNPNVGCILLDAQGRVAGRGWTQPGGRPHAEAVALAQAGERARGGTAYVTLEPCAHDSIRGPCCADLLTAAGIARAVVAMADPDPRTDGAGFVRLQQAGIAPFHHALRAGVAEIGLEAGTHLLERFVLVAEEGEGRRIAVLFGIFRVEGRILVARPVEDNQVLVLGDCQGGRRCRQPAGQRQRQCQSACQALHRVVLPCPCVPVMRS